MEIDDTKFVSLIKEKIPNLIDTTVEKDANLMKDVNVMGYFLELLEFMKQNPLPIDQLLLNYAQNKFHQQNGITNKMKQFISILFYSYLKKANNSQDLSFIKRYFLTKKSNASITFYIKLRKTILTNFSYTSRSQMLDGLNLKFDDWSTITTRFLGAESISQIGSKVKEVNSKTKVYDKILTNSIDAVVFVATCVELFESRQPQQKSTDQFENQSGLKKKNSRSSSQHSQQNQEDTSQNDIEENEENENENNNSMIEQPEISTQQIQISQEQNKLSQLNKQDRTDASKTINQQKLINSLQETKYQLLDFQQKQGQTIGKIVTIYEHLSEDYVNLQKHSKKQNQFLNYLLNKLKTQNHNISEQDKKTIEELNSFKYEQQDFKEVIKKTGAYNYIL